MTARSNPLLLALASAALSCAPLLSHASDGLITIEGGLAASTCTISGPASFTVVLPTVPAHLLTTEGETAGRTAFAINVNNCEASLTGANVFFESGPNAHSWYERLINTASSGQATGVLLELRDSRDEAVDLGAIYQNQYLRHTNNLSASTNSGKVEFSVQYYATGAATPGAVTSNVTYTMVYN